MDKIAILKDRAKLLKAVRHFFNERGITEVDTPLISAYASVDAHIDLIVTSDGRFLHSSPEYGMKRLIADGMGDIFQLSHVFRSEEIGKKHNPEFMMAEWYRLNFSFQKMIDETLDFIRLFLGNLPQKQLTYRETFIEYAGIDPANVTIEELSSYCLSHQLPLYQDIESEGIDAFLNIILGQYIEPQLGQDHLFTLSHYPSSQAALAVRLQSFEYSVAERFEVYYQGVELANGYHELADPKEQRERLLEANKHRLQLKKRPLPIDENFLQALEKGLPDCCGVAVGFDRLLMLKHKVKGIDEVIPFSWDQA